MQTPEEFATHRALQMARDPAGPITSERHETVCSRGGERTIWSGAFMGGEGGNLARGPLHVCVQLTSAVNTEGNATQ